MQLIDLGKLRFNFAGAWLIGTAYERNDVIKYGGNVYCYTYALKEAGVLPTDTAHWALMVKGIDFQGVFGDTTAYKVGDGVAHGGKVYVAIADSTGATPPDVTKWSQFVDGIQYEGEYSGSASYQKNDIVKYGGVVYIAKLDTSGNLPTSATYWDRFVDGISPQSVFNTATAYVPNDLVAYGANIYRALVSSTNVVPTTDPTKWELWVGGSAFMGVFSAATAYQIGQVVTYGGGVYRATVDTVAGQLPTDAAKFAPLFVGMSFEGVYSAAVAYKTGETVTHGSNLYRANQDTVAGDPPTGSKFTLISTGFRNRGTWTTTTTYILNDVVGYGGNSYIALVGHASTSFATDLAASKWQKFNSGIRSRGAWTTATAYLKDDLVSDDLSTYIALVDYTSGASVADDLTALNLGVLARGAVGVPVPDATTIGKLLSNDGTSPYWFDAAIKYTAINANTAAASGSNYLVDTSVSAITLTLPAAPVVDDIIRVADAKGTFKTNNLTVSGNGNQVARDATLVIDIANAAISLIYTAADGWVLV